MNTIPTVGMLVAATPAQVVFWQWLNQSVNVMCNYVNRSGATVEWSQVGQAYALAVGVSCGIAVGARKLVEAGPPAVKRLGIAVPYAAVVLADLNQTPWSTAYRHLIRDARLQDARRGQWPRKTWRPRRSWLVGLPIDHVLYRGAVQVEQFRLGPDVGSDHLPLLADLALGSGEASDH